MIQANRVRIIGGRWRGRKLTLPLHSTIRPTPDRVRETLFNWLAPVITGASCLDLFTGSGGLGFEAVSRGAAGALLIDRDAATVRHLQEQAALFGCPDIVVEHADVMAWLRGRTGRSAQRFDLVFLDPPYRQGLLAECCALLESGGYLRDQARIYLELARKEVMPPLPENWSMLKDKTAGQVRYCLALRQSGSGRADEQGDDE